jgi:hypothetical protein
MFVVLVSGLFTVLLTTKPPPAIPAMVFMLLLVMIMFPPALLFIPCIELMICGEVPLLAIDCNPALFEMLDGKLPRFIWSTTFALATETLGGDCKLGLLLPNCPPAIAKALLIKPLLP